MAKNTNKNKFKYIVKRKQKRKDKKKVYYYYSYTDKKIVSKSDYTEGLELRKKFKNTFGKDWFKKFKSATSEIKKIDKQQKKFTLEQKRKEVEKYQLKYGFLSKEGIYEIFDQPINFSIVGKMFEYVELYGKVFIYYNQRYYELTEDRFGDFTFFVFYILDTYYKYLQELDKDKLDSPMILFTVRHFINGNDYPDIFFLDLTSVITNIEVRGTKQFLDNTIRESFNENIFDLPVVNLYEYAFNNKLK